MVNPYQSPREVNERQAVEKQRKPPKEPKWVLIVLIPWGAFMVYTGYEVFSEGKMVIGAMTSLVGAVFVVTFAIQLIKWPN